MLEYFPVVAMRPETAISPSRSHHTSDSITEPEQEKIPVTVYV